MAELKFPTLEELGRQGGEWAINEFEYKGLTIRQWADKITAGEYQPVKHGHWIEREYLDGDIYYECSVCNEAFAFDEGTPEDNNYLFCPNCSAKMKGDEINV
jgi:DNA-directed RNA polymerase subunit RPC12/RpoP